MLVIVLFVVVIYCYHGDGSDRRHVCTKYHGNTYYYQQIIGCYVGLRLFVVGGEGNGSGGAHLYTKYHGRTQHYLLVIG